MSAWIKIVAVILALTIVGMTIPQKLEARSQEPETTEVVQHYPQFSPLWQSTLSIAMGLVNPSLRQTLMYSDVDEASDKTEDISGLFSENQSPASNTISPRSSGLELDVLIAAAPAFRHDGLALVTRKNTWAGDTHPQDHDEMVKCVEQDSIREDGWSGASVVREVQQDENIHGKTTAHNENYTSYYECFFYVGITGDWQFGTRSTGASEVQVDETVVARKYSGVEGRNDGTIDIDIGWHRFIYRYEQGTTKSNIVQAFYKTPQAYDWTIFGAGAMAPIGHNGNETIYADPLIVKPVNLDAGLLLTTRKNIWNSAPEDYDQMVQCVDLDSTEDPRWSGSTIVNMLYQDKNIHGNDYSYTSYYEVFFYVDIEGVWSFANNSDGASDIEIDGQILASWYGNHEVLVKEDGSDNWDVHQGSIELSQGWHRLVYRQVELTGEQGARAAFKKPGDEKWRSLHNAELTLKAACRVGMDGDNLPDTVELVLGTNPESMDTDTDLLDDWYEVKNGLDPLKADSNGDGLMDYNEVTGYPLDIDGDGIPNAWDDDNDNDGVPDDLDASPFSMTTVNESFQFHIKGDGQPTYLELQVRPENTDHMRLTAQTWDWPDDDKATIQDIDRSKKDLQIAPVLELTLDKSPGTTAEMKDYGISVFDQSIAPTAEKPWSADIQSLELNMKNEGGGPAMADINRNGMPDLLLLGVPRDHSDSSVDDFLYCIGWDLDASGQPTNGWSDKITVPGIANKTTSGGAAIADIDKDGTLDLLLMVIVGAEGRDNFGYKVGWGLCTDGRASSWGQTSVVDGMGDFSAGGGAAIADIDNNGKKDLVLMVVDDPEGPNEFRYKIGWDLSRSSAGQCNAKSWTTGTSSPDISAHFTGGGGLAIADMDGNGRLDLVFMAIDSTPRGIRFQYLVGWNMDNSGNPGSWSPLMTQGWTKFYNDLNEGAGGKYIYLCVKEPLVDKIKVISGNSADISPGAGWTKLPEDLNTGAGGKYIYLCVQEFLKERLKVISGDSPDITPGDGWIKLDQDLNEGATKAGRKYIYLCVKETLAGMVKIISSNSADILPDGGVMAHGGGLLIVDIDKNGRPDLMLMSLDDLSREDRFRYTIGWDIMPQTKVYVPLLPLEDNNSTVAYSGKMFFPAIDKPLDVRAEARLVWMVNVKSDLTGLSWSDVKKVYALDNKGNEGGGVAVADIDCNGKNDLVLMQISAENQANKFYYYIGWDLDARGNPTRDWTLFTQNLSTWNNTGGDMAIYDINGNGKLDILLMGIDHPSYGPDTFHYMIGWDLNQDGKAARWSDEISSPADLLGTGWIQLPEDLNKGTGGKYIYLCVKDSLKDLVKVMIGSKSDWGNNGERFDPGEGWVKIEGNLNEKAGRKGDEWSWTGQFIYLCIRPWLKDQFKVVIKEKGETLTYQGADWVQFPQDLNEGEWLESYEDERQIYLYIQKSLVGQVNIISGNSADISHNAPSRGGGAALGDINGNGKADLLMMQVEDNCSNDCFRYNIGWDLDASGRPSGGWSPTMQQAGIGPGWDNNGGGAALADLNGNGILDLLLMCIDNPEGNNSFRYMIGWDLDANGMPVNGWNSPLTQNGLTTSSNIDGGVTVTDINNDRKLDVVMTATRDTGSDYAWFYTIGWGVETETRSLARYRERFMLTGFTITENHGTEEGVFYSQDANQTLRASLALRYEFLNNSQTATQAAAVLAQHNITVSSDIRQFSHSDAATAKLASEMIAGALDSLPSGKRLPLAIAISNSSINTGMDTCVADSYILGNRQDFDLTGIPPITLKALKLPWYDTSARELVEEDGILAEVGSWDWDVDQKTGVALLLLTLSEGETNMTALGDSKVLRPAPEKSQMLATIYGKSDILTHLRLAFQLPLRGVWALSFALSAISEPQCRIDYLANIREWSKPGYGFTPKEAKKMALNFAWRYQWENNYFNPIRSAITSNPSPQGTYKPQSAGRFFNDYCKFSGWKFVKSLQFAGRVLLAATALTIIGQSLYIAGKEGFSRLGLEMGAIYAAKEIIYYAMITTVACIPYVGWALAFAVLFTDIIASCFGKGSDWVMEKIINALVTYDLCVELSMDSQEMRDTLEDYAGNGPTAGDYFELTSRISGRADEIDLGDHGYPNELVDSYITPHYFYDVPGVYQSGKFTITTYVQGEINLDHDWIERTYDSGVWFIPSKGVINLPLTVWLQVDYQTFYIKKTAGHYPESGDPINGTSESDKTTLFFDILPDSLDDFLKWTGVASLDRDSDRLNDNVETGQAGEINYRIISKAGDLVLQANPSSSNVEISRYEGQANQQWKLKKEMKPGEFMLTASNGKYVVMDGDFQLKATSDTPADTTKFKIVHLGDNGIALMTANGKYVTVDTGNHDALQATSASIPEREGFTIEYLDNGDIALKASTGKYVSADLQAYPGELVAAADEIQAKERFQVIWSGYFQVAVSSTAKALADQDESGEIALETWDGNYLKVPLDYGPANTHYIKASGPITEYYRFKIIDLGNNRVALQSPFNSKYATVRPYHTEQTTYYLFAEADSIGNNEQFSITHFYENNYDYIALKAYTGNYVYDDPGNAMLTANGDKITERSKFRIRYPEANVSVSSYADNNNHKWYLESTQNGYYRIINKRGMVLTIAGEAYNRSNVIVRDTYTGSDNQKWKLELVNSSTDKLKWDTDADGLPDGFEAYSLVDLGANPNLPDTDQDGLNDRLEMQLGTNPANADTDGDGLTDYEENCGWQISLTYRNQPFTQHVWPYPLQVDSDGDGLTDYQEYLKKTNPRSKDTDGDGVSDYDAVNASTLSLQTPVLLSIPLDFQTDPLPASTLEDSDDDGLIDAVETDGWKINIRYAGGVNNILETSDPWLKDTDGDGLTDDREYNLTNPRSVDTDGDGLNDFFEISGWDIVFMDVDGSQNTVHEASNPAHWDIDNDGLDDGIEKTLRTNPNSADTDGDGLNDAEEVNGWDITRGDDEGQSVHITSCPLAADTDEDGLSDAEEKQFGTDPASWDTDYDNLDDFIEINGWEAKYIDTAGEHTIKVTSNPWLSDTDADGLSDHQEYMARTHPRSVDTDGDGLNDIDEPDLWINPLKADTDGDELTDSEEVMKYGTNPLSRDSDNDDIEDKEDTDTYASPPEKIYVLYDAEEDDYHEFINGLSQYTEVISGTLDDPEFQNNKYNEKPYLVILGYPDGKKLGTASRIAYDLLTEDIRQKMLESDYKRFATGINIWPYNKMVIMLSRPYHSDHWRILAKIKGLRYKITENSVSLIYPEARQSFFLEAIKEIDFYLVEVDLIRIVTPSLKITRHNAGNPLPLNIPPLGINTGLAEDELAVGKYMDIRVSENVQDDSVKPPVDNIEKAQFRIYYTASELDRNWDGDNHDIGDINENSLCLYRWNTASGQWEKLSSLDGVNSTGVETVNVQPYDKPYEGFVWSDVDHFSLYALAGKQIEGEAVEYSNLVSADIFITSPVPSLSVSNSTVNYPQILVSPDSSATPVPIVSSKASNTLEPPALEPPSSETPSSETRALPLTSTSTFQSPVEIVKNSTPFNGAIIIIIIAVILAVLAVIMILVRRRNATLK